MPSTAEWWRNAVIYQIYPRSFADANGDGVGDLAGVRTRLPHLKALGVDAIWFSPWYASPQADAGYDVADYRRIDPLFGDLTEAETLIGEAHALDIKVLVDVVPNHVSSDHEWFRQAVAEGPGSPARERFWFRPGRGENGDLPPNQWRSVFGGPAWTRISDPDGTPGEWYLHLFAPGQPDLNWNDPEVHREHEAVLRFWFERGADGVRIDSATMPVKDPELSDFDPDAPPTPHPYVNRPEVHEIYRSWRRVAESYDRPRALIGEVWLNLADQAAYLHPDELHTVFNFDYLNCAWDAAALRGVVDATLAVHEPLNAPATWVFSNHDVTRHVTRFGRADTSYVMAGRQHGTPVDLELGMRRARAALLLSLGLPGSVYLYQGEELGLWEVEDIPAALRQDPIFHRTDGADIGRDGCRVPLPWSGAEPPFGFSPENSAAAPWLPQPAAWKDMTAEAQNADDRSMLAFYRTAIATRRSRLADLPTRLIWLDLGPDVLAFRRDGFTCVVNFRTTDLDLPEHTEVVLTSAALSRNALPPHAAAWLF